MRNKIKSKGDEPKKIIGLKLNLTTGRVAIELEGNYNTGLELRDYDCPPIGAYISIETNYYLVDDEEMSLIKARKEKEDEDKKTKEVEKKVASHTPGFGGAYNNYNR